MGRVARVAIDIVGVFQRTAIHNDHRRILVHAITVLATLHCSLVHDERVQFQRTTDGQRTTTALLQTGLRYLTDGTIQRQRLARIHLDSTTTLAYRKFLTRHDGTIDDKRSALAQRDEIVHTTQGAILCPIGISQRLNGQRTVFHDDASRQSVGIQNGQVACASFGQRGSTDNAAHTCERIILFFVLKHKRGWRHQATDIDLLLGCLITERHSVACHEEALRTITQEEILRTGKIPRAVFTTVPAHIVGLAQWFHI